MYSPGPTAAPASSFLKTVGILQVFLGGEVL